MEQARGTHASFSSLPFPEKPGLIGVHGIQKEGETSSGKPESSLGFTLAPSGSQNDLEPACPPALARLLLSWLSAYLNLLMKTCFTVQSTDGSSSLPKEKHSANRESKLPPGDGWLGTPRPAVGKHFSVMRTSWSTWGDKTALGGQCLPTIRPPCTRAEQYRVQQTGPLCLPPPRSWLQLLCLPPSPGWMLTAGHKYQ